MKQSNSKKIKLYRGIKAPEFIERDEEIDTAFREGWAKLLEYRAGGDLSYPEELNDTVIEMNKLQPFTRQYFTDRKEIAERYAKDTSGVLVEMEVPVKDILEHFIVEFQNYSKRKDVFEIVYIVKGSDICKYKDAWNFKVQQFKD